MMKLKFILMSILVLGCLCMAKNVQAADSDNIAYEHTFKTSGWNTPAHDILTVQRGNHSTFGPYMTIRNETGLGSKKVKCSVVVYDTNGNDYNACYNMTGTGPGAYFMLSEGTTYKVTMLEVYYTNSEVTLRYRKEYTATWGATLTGYFNPWVTQ